MVTVVNMPSRSAMLGQAAGKGIGEGVSAGIKPYMDLLFKRQQAQMALNAMGNLYSPSGQPDQAAFPQTDIPSYEEPSGLLSPPTDTSAMGLLGVPGQTQAPQAFQADQPQARMAQQASIQPQAVQGPLERSDREIDLRSSQAAAALGDLSLKPKIAQEMRDQNAEIRRQRQEALDIEERRSARSQVFEGFLGRRLPNLGEEEYNDFLRLGSKYESLPLDDWFAATNREFQKLKSAESALGQARFPGGLQSLMDHGRRQEAIGNLSDISKTFVDMGQEDKARKILTESYDLSPAEIERILNPLNKTVERKVESLEDGSFFKGASEIESFGWKPLGKLGRIIHKKLSGKNLPMDYVTAKKEAPKLVEKQNKDLSNVISSSVKQGNSLLSLRSALLDKGYDSKQIVDAFRDVRDDLKLSARQNVELNEFFVPPKDSISSIFYDWSRMGEMYSDFARGKR